MNFFFCFFYIVFGIFDDYFVIFDFISREVDGNFIKFIINVFKDFITASNKVFVVFGIYMYFIFYNIVFYEKKKREIFMK